MLNRIDVQGVVALARKAGEAIMEIYQKNFEVEFKADQSPLTEADKAAHSIIEAGLKGLDQKNNTVIPLMSEEGKNIPFKDRKDWEYYWLVDPVDGSKEVIKKNGEFTVNMRSFITALPCLALSTHPHYTKCIGQKKVKVHLKMGKNCHLKQSNSVKRTK